MLYFAMIAAVIYLAKLCFTFCYIFQCFDVVFMLVSACR